tara:strand:+ start:2914 stop:3384 length:471 start_codon:yes stop_codon:yes gene_type:complete
VIVDDVINWDKLPWFSHSKIWTRAFEWLKTEAPQSEDGVFSLGTEGFYARVMRYPLVKRSKGKYEMHRRTIDIQCTIKGGEGIETTPQSVLGPSSGYDLGSDFEYFLTPKSKWSMIENRAGRFTLLFPGEPHMPGLKISGCSEVVKAVVKIPVSLI